MLRSELLGQQPRRRMQIPQRPREDAPRGLREVTVDVRKLTFVNSSAIRLFVDWATWVRDQEPDAYVIRFRTDRRITWQRTSFSVLQSLAPNAIVIDAE